MFDTSAGFNEDLHFIRLSYFLSQNSPVHPELEKPQIIPKNSISNGDDYNTSIIIAENHCGTHVDAPAHFIDNSRRIADYSPEDLIFHKPFYFHCPKKPDELITKADVSKIKNKEYDCILIGTDFSKYRDQQEYLINNPGMSPEAISYMRSSFPNLKCLGIDTISMSRYGRPDEAKEVHLTGFIERRGYFNPLIFLEDLNLSPLSRDNRIESIIVVPWQIADIDSAPCTVLAEIKLHY